MKKIKNTLNWRKILLCVADYSFFLILWMLLGLNLHIKTFGDSAFSLFISGIIVYTGSKCILFIMKRIMKVISHWYKRTKRI